MQKGGDAGGENFVRTDGLAGVGAGEVDFVRMAFKSVAI